MIAEDVNATGVRFVEVEGALCTRCCWELFLIFMVAWFRRFGSEFHVENDGTRNVLYFLDLSFVLFCFVLFCCEYKNIN